jgi:hypothetical protein
MEIKINKKYFLLLLGALLFIGTSIIYHANLTERITSYAIYEEMNLSQTNISEEFEDLNLKIIKLNEDLVTLKEDILSIDSNLSNIKNYVVGGGYEGYERSITYNDGENSITKVGGGSYCKVWGDANCSQNKLICPANYTKFQTGHEEYSDGNKKWFLCVN